MIGLPVCEERTASSTHFTNQNVYLVFETYAYVLYNVYFIFRTGFCMTEIRTEKLSMHSTFINQHKQRTCGSCAGAGFQALLLHVVSPVLRQPVMALDMGCSQHIVSLGRNHCVFGQFKTGTALPHGLLATPSHWPGPVVTFKASWEAPVMVVF